MPSALLSLLSANPSRLDELSISQVVALCGKGKLTDQSECSQQLREYLRIAKSGNLCRYVSECLEGSESGGLALQDVVNEFGRRLDYQVEDGLYRGKTNAIGFDGIWRSPGHTLVIEVKTTDAYRINLDTIANYRDELQKSGKLAEDSSILLVVGRQDTGDLEAQVRGSKHAWTVRIISVDALSKLVLLKENSEKSVLSRIRELLVPFEYTRLDRIIELAFTVAEDAAIALQEDQVSRVFEAALPPQSGDTPYSPHRNIADVRNQILSSLAKWYAPPIKRSRALYSTADGRSRFAITISKRYDAGNYWYAYHPDWDEFLGQGGDAFFVLGCVDRPDYYLIPRNWIRELTPKLNVTVRASGDSHWHIHLHPDESGRMVLKLKSGDTQSIEQFRVALQESGIFTR